MRNSTLRSSLMWSMPALLVAFAVAIPLLAVLSALSTPTDAVSAHLRSTVLSDYAINSALLVLLTGGLAIIFGTATAWLTGACQFFGSRLLSWLLVLPLAAPAYVVAYAYTDLLDVSGPLQTALRAWLGVTPREFSLPSIRNLPGAAVLLALVLYPYVYLLARNSFSGRSGAHFDAARVLGQGPYKAFFRVALPAARPAIAGGAALVMMEALADFGVVEYFSVPTFSTGIYRTWIGLGEKTAALKLAAYMLLFVFALITFETVSRRGSVDSNDLSRAAPIRLSGWHAAAAYVTCALPVLLGFVFPTVLLVSYSVDAGDGVLARGFASYFSNSVSVALFAAVVCVLLAVLLAYSQRLSRSRWNSIFIRWSTLGYALPGVLLAIALLAPVAALDRWLMHLFAAPAPILGGTLFILLYAYVCRFLTVAFQSVSAGLGGISGDLDAAARSLGASPGRVAGQIHWPLLRPSLLAAGLLVFVDVMRELPATLLLRPFNFDTLATRVYRLAGDERLAEAAPAALCIVLIGVLPVILLTRSARRRG